MGQTNDKTSKKVDKSRENGRRADRFNDATFVQYELDKDAQAACKAWKMDADASFNAIHTMVDCGYSFTLKFDTFSDSYAAFCSQKAPEGENAGFILTGRGSTPEKALKQLFYKHFEVMAERWEQFAVSRSAREIDD